MAASPADRHPPKRTGHKPKSIRRVLVCGGSGYGNLGDELIVEATLVALRRSLGDVEIVVMSYDPEETARRIPLADTRMVRSVHRAISGRLPMIIFAPIDPPAGSPWLASPLLPLPQITTTWGRRAIKALTCWLLLKWRFLGLTPAIQAEFRQADLFVQAGGGYFMDAWRDMAVARFLELQMARIAKTRILVLGQSIGPFERPKSRRMLQRRLAEADVISVRDPDSWESLQALGLRPHLLPDTALMLTGPSAPRRNELALIVNNDPTFIRFEGELCRAVADAAKQLGCAVKVILTRLWQSDLKSAQAKQNQLARLGTEVEVCVPQSVAELQTMVGACRALISQNLHGMIVGWRVGVACVSLSRGPKFDSFMDQTNQSNRRFTPTEIPWPTLTQWIVDAAKEEPDMEFRRRIASTIATEIERYLASIDGADCPPAPSPAV